MIVAILMLWLAVILLLCCVLYFRRMFKDVAKILELQQDSLDAHANCIPMLSSSDRIPEIFFELDQLRAIHGAHVSPEVRRRAEEILAKKRAQ